MSAGNSPTEVAMENDEDFTIDRCPMPSKERGMIREKLNKYEMEESNCPFCSWIGLLSGKACCDAASPVHHYFCTREKGHGPPHVACGDGVHKLETWGDPFEAQ